MQIEIKANKSLHYRTNITGINKSLQTEANLLNTIITEQSLKIDLQSLFFNSEYKNITPVIKKTSLLMFTNVYL